MSNTRISVAFKYVSLSIPATLLIIAPNYVDPINLPKLIALAAFSFLAVVHFLALKNYYPNQDVSNLKQRILFSIYIFLALSMILSGIFGSDNLMKVFFGTSGRNNGLLYYLSAILLALIILKLNIGKLEENFLLKTLVYSSSLFALYSLLQFFNLDPIKWSNPYNRVIGTLGNPNFSSSVLAIFAILWIYQAIRMKSRNAIYKTGFVLGSMVMVFLSWATASIQGMVVFVLGLALIAYSILREKNSSRSIPLIFFLGGSLVLTFVFASFLGFGPLGQSLEQYTLRLRGWYASFGLRAMMDSPLFGVGVDNYISAFRSYRTSEFISRYGVMLSTNNAHSTPAQIGATFGIVVFVLYCILQLWILVRALKLISSENEIDSNKKVIAIIWILIFAQSLLSIEIIGLGTLNWVLGAVIMKYSLSVTDSADIRSDTKSLQSHKAQPKLLKLPAWTGSFSILMIALSSIPAVFISQEQKAYRNVISMKVESVESQQWVRSNFQKLTSLTLQDSDNVERLIYNLYQSQMYNEVEKVLKDLVKKNPRDVYANDLLASYYLNTNQPNKELEIRKKLRDLDPLNYQLELSLARSLARSNNTSGLKESVSRIQNLAPQSIEYIEAEKLLKESQVKANN